MREMIRRELRIAFSPRGQPVWFRVVKWIVFIAITVMCWRKPAFWWCVVAALIVGLSIHLLYRHKTDDWTRPWGGWNDLGAGKFDR